MANDTTNDCPSRQQLVSLLNETLPLGDDTSKHVAECTLCQLQLDQLTESEQMADYRSHAIGNANITRFLGEPRRDGDLGSLGDFAIEEQIGIGGMGIVFRGRDDALGRKIAVKILQRLSSPESDVRFVRESKAAAKLNHDHVVPVYASGRTSDGTPYLIMRLVEGMSLKEKLKTTTLPLRESAEYVSQIARGLHAAHEAELIHRDVKPANILLDAIDGRAKLTDFGLARSDEDRSLTQANVISGTPEYISPEYITNPRANDRRGDIYALGITLYECLTGTTPFRGQPMQVLQQHQFSEPIRPTRLNVNIPRDLEVICLKAISKEPEGRYQTAQEFADDLQRYLDGQPVLARDTTQLEKLLKWSRRNPRSAALTATTFGLLLLLGVGASLAAWRLSVANATVLGERDKATAAEQRALNDRTAAVDALSTLVESLYDDLANDAATIKAREKVISAAIDGLKSLTRVSEDRKADQTAMLAYTRIGDLLALQGSEEEAEKNYEKAIELARDIVTEQPASQTAKRNLASSLGSLGRHFIQIGNDRANVPIEEGLLLLQDIVAADPNDYEALALLIEQQGAKLDIIRRGGLLDQAATIEFGESLIPDIEKLFSRSNENLLALKAAHGIHFRLGRAHLESYGVKKADEHFTLARGYLDRALDISPDRVELRAASAVLDRAQAMVLGSLGRIGESLVLFQRALDTLQELAKSNPDDQEQPFHIANTKTIMSEAFFAMGQFDKGIAQLEEALATYVQLSSQALGDENLRRMIINAKFSILKGLMAWDKWEESLVMLEEVQVDLANFDLADDYRQYFSSLASVNYEGLKRFLDPDTSFENKTRNGECVALVLAATDDAIGSTSEQLSDTTSAVVAKISDQWEGKTVTELFEYIRGLPGVTQEVGFDARRAEARVYALLARNCAESTLPDGSQRSQAWLMKCIEVIAEIAQLQPNAATEMILADPHLAWVRQQEPFHVAWEEISPP